jgi:O-methyltransferase involved in polyketide biosynthesis
MSEDSSSGFAGGHPPAGIDETVPHSARIWNYWLGGHDNYPVDREVGDEFLAIFPEIVDIARHARYFLARAVRYLVGVAGIRQFLDIGTGLPTENNTHEVAQRVAPESRIVYVDHDPLVLVHARTLLTGTPEGATDYIDADLRDPEIILAEAANTLDSANPIAIMLLGVLGHIPDYDEARSIVSRLLDAVRPGSYLVISDGTDVLEQPSEPDVHETRRARAMHRYNEASSAPYHLRTPEQIAGFFAGLQLVEPGIVSTPQWRPDPSHSGLLPELDVFCGVGRKPQQ